MAKNAVTICNKALSRIGIKQYITDLSADQTEEAETANVFYEDTRDLLLAAYPWPFATARAQLAVRSDEPTRAGWSFVYGAPADCLQTRYIYPVGLARGVTATMADLYPPNQVMLDAANPRAPRSDQRIPFMVEKSSQDDGQVILCDVQDAVLFYTARVTDPEKFPAAFADALAWLLAAEMAMPLTIDPKKEEMARRRHMMSVSSAFAGMMNGQREDAAPVPEMIAARG